MEPMKENGKFRAQVSKFKLKRIETLTFKLKFSKKEKKKERKENSEFMYFQFNLLQKK